MKILHYLLGLPPVRGGGLVKYVLNLAEEERALGHEAELLVPDKIRLCYDQKSKIKRKDWNDIPCYRIQNPLPILIGQGIQDVKCLYNRGDKEVYLHFLKKCAPDIIHIHSFMGLHVAFLEAASELDIPLVYTTHDYYGLCIKASLLKDNSICREDNWNYCAICQERKASIRRLAWEQSDSYRWMKKNRLYRWLESSPSSAPFKLFIREVLKKIKRKEQKKLGNKEPESDIQQDYNRLREYYREMFGYITKFHFNSSQSREVFEKHLGVLEGDVITISNTSISDHRIRREYENSLRIGFIGYGIPQKGFFLLKNALDGLYEKGVRNFECHVYFSPKERTLPYLKSHAPYKSADVDRIYGNMDLLVLPSIWQETFGMVVLEALSYGVPVILSNYVGAREVLEEHEGMGIVIEPETENLQEVIGDLIQHREKLCQMNQAICSWEKDFSFEGHVKKIIEFYAKIL